MAKSTPVAKLVELAHVGAGREVVIVGAGIGGLTTAIALKQLGFAVSVYEAASEFKPVGAGILLAPNAMQVLERLGVSAQIQAVGHPLVHTMQVTDHQLQPIQRFDGMDEQAMFGYHSTTIHRGALQQVLLDALGPERVHTGKRCLRVEQNDTGATLFCDDGTQVEGAILLAADGLHSVVRNQLFPGNLRYSGETCWRGVADLTAGEEWNGRGFEMWGKGVRLGILPISDTQMYWFSTAKVPAGGKDESPDAVKEMLLKRFANFGGPAIPVLQATPAAQIMRHDLHDFAPIPRWTKGRIALLGDAAHATTPNMGQGGGQAIEDAWGMVLAMLQEKALPDALVRFQELRQDKARMVVNNSYRFGKVAQLTNPLLCWLRNAVLRYTPASVIHKQLQELYSINDLPAELAPKP